ncbi:MAG: Crp/Fnr family transcriptional regulator [Rhizobiaceae bacterium]|nr:Crp/Fnr family transcriptional regulator [Rhizobiaceae bacterium]MCV0405807.1 Crp/Fnr family transcriptional regulator [Rhizobiaceae bacterium]
MPKGPTVTKYDDEDLDDERAAPLKTRLSEDLFDMMFAGCTHENFPAGRHLFLQDDPADRVYGVISGTVEIAIFSMGGRKLVANMETPRSLIGEIAVLDGGRRTATASCISDCVLVSLSRSRLFDRIERNPPLARAMIDLLCARLRWVSGELGDQALLKIEARLAKRLIFLTGLIGDRAGWVSISQSELAGFLGATRESVNKTLTDWRRDGLIDIKRGGLLVKKVERLEAIANYEDD